MMASLKDWDILPREFIKWTASLRIGFKESQKALMILTVGWLVSVYLSQKVNETLHITLYCCSQATLLVIVEDMATAPLFSHNLDVSGYRS